MDQMTDDELKLVQLNLMAAAKAAAQVAVDVENIVTVGSGFATNCPKEISEMLTMATAFGQAAEAAASYVDPLKAKRNVNERSVTR
jgi:hypothetical protein